MSRFNSFVVIVGMATVLLGNNDCCLAGPPNISGVWHNAGRANEPCRIWQFGDKVFFRDEHDYIGVARIVGNKLRVGTYLDRYGLTAEIQDGGKRLAWPGNHWSLARRDNNVAVFIEALLCNRENDDGLRGEDEVFLVVAGAKSNGEQFTARLGTWDFRDGGSEKRKRNNIPLWQGDLAKGEWVEFVVDVIEEDDTSDDVDKAISEAARRIATEIDKKRRQEGDNGFSLRPIVDVVLTLVDLRNRHDHLGSVSCRVERKASGELNVKWSPVRSVRKTGDPGELYGRDTSVGKFDVHGEGGQYDLWVSPWDGTFPVLK